MSGFRWGARSEVQILGYHAQRSAPLEAVEGISVDEWRRRPMTAFYVGDTAERQIGAMREKLWRRLFLSSPVLQRPRFAA